MAKNTKLILSQVENERYRQDLKWGADRVLDDSVWLTILTEEVGEAAKAVLEGGDIESELIQIAAVAVAWHEAKWRRHETVTVKP